MMARLTRLTLLIATGMLTLTAVTSGAEPVSFDREIRPIFAQHCVACHGGVKQAGGLSFVYRDNVFAGGDSGAPAVVPGDVVASYLVERVTDADPDMRMPPADHGRALSDAEIDNLKRWIAEGAAWEQPWAFVAPQKVTPPHVINSDWPRGAIDHFILSRLEAAKLVPSPAADRAEWLRRVSFDLIGLPPTLSEIDDFANDSRADAFERAVDRLLASPHFGERWAAMWLDLARYADTTGYEKDPHRDIWPYRDWVIRAFNDDMPFDKFTVSQLAGDLLESASLDDRVATAFHRNTQTNTEGGTDDEEFRNSAVIDRANTTWQVWQATTFGCTQCHSHPYEAIRHEEYYQFIALFNNTRDADVDQDLPRLDVPLSREDDSRMQANLARQSQLRKGLHRLMLPLTEQSGAWRNLVVDQAKSTGNTVLRIQKNEDSQAPTEIRVEGAATMGSQFTIEAPLPADLRQLTAVRIDALLRNPESARKLPELGFVVSHLKISLLTPGNDEPQELEIAYAFSDEPEPVLDPEDSLKDNPMGWGSYSRQWYPQYGVFLLERPVSISPGSRIRIELAQKVGASGDIPLVLNRSTYAISDSDEWESLQQSERFQKARRELADLKRERKQIASVSMPIVEELELERKRTTFVFERGLWLDKGAEVRPGVPATLAAHSAERPNRLDMARWLVSNENPLTARVMVNRVWAELFGTGIVETVDNFGVSGTRPSHPELLDYLAVTFRDEYAWSIKCLLKEIVLSATYRQTARRNAANAMDPDNRLLSHGPRERLSAEMVRDQALILSGKFSPKQFGPPVMPPQPEGIWRSVYNGAKWVTAKGEDRYRRAIYTFWKRTSGYPAMMTFDMPSREVCTGQRIATNTPLQALVTLNDEAFLELADGLAARMSREGGVSVSDQIAWAYHIATSDAPTQQTIDHLQNLYKKTLQEYKSKRSDNDEVNTPEHEALVIVASTILNLDEALTK
jgi:mono/diheme cytochrome c family protein